MPSRPFPFLLLLASSLLLMSAAPAPTTQPRAIRVVVSADDMGAAQAINLGCIEAHKSGIVRSVEVMVPGPWFLDAVRLIKENPDLDVGVALTLTSEWERVKWRPLTRGPSLVDADGYFLPTPQDWITKPDITEVELELRAQIETARRHLGDRVTHLSARADGAAASSPQLKQLADELAQEYKLRPVDSVQRTGTFGDKSFSVDQRQKSLAALLDKLQPGDWLLVATPGYDSPELRGFSRTGYENVASDRANVRRALTNEQVLKVVKRRGIKLITFRDL